MPHAYLHKPDGEVMKSLSPQLDEVRVKVVTNDSLARKLDST